MDRRKIKSKNVLHKQLHSSSQTVTKTLSESSKDNSVARSVSADNNVSLSRKRKNSEEEGQKEGSLDNSPMKASIIRKKRRNIVDDDEDEGQKEVSPKRVAPGEKASNKQSRKLSSDSDGHEDSENKSTSNSRSHIKGMLEAIDKSPAKLSQSSNTSMDKYRKMNLRTPVRSKAQKPVSKVIAERKTQSTDKSMQERADKTTNDPRLRKDNLKSVLSGPSSRQEDVSNASNDGDTSTSEEEISFSGNDVAPKKKTDKKVEKASKAVSSGSKSPAKKATPTKSREVRALESPELSPLKSFNSPEKLTHVNTRKRKTCVQSDDKFINFLDAVGITLYSGENLHCADDDPREVIQKMKELLHSETFDADEIIECWSNYVENEENLKKSLLEIKIETDGGVEVGSKAVSLSRLLLQVPQLQVEILNILFRKLIDAVIAAECSDDAPWALQMLYQFRFLEIMVDPDLLIARIEELLSSSPEWFQREIIVLIPDIVTDTQHRTTAEMLTKIMESNKDLTNIILDCIYNLILGKDYREELREQILRLLDKKVDISTVPAITRFVLNACSTEVIALKSLTALRRVDMSPSAKQNIEECYTNQSFMVNAIKLSIQLFKEVSQAATTMIKNPPKEEKEEKEEKKEKKVVVVPLDIILCILLHETTPAKKKIVEATLHSHIKEDLFKTSHLNVLYSGYKQVARNFQSTALNLAFSLLKVDSPSHVEFGIEWLRNIFISQSDTPYKQREIMEKLLNLMGNKDKTVKNALEVLSRMANDETERKYLQQHAGFLRSFLEKVDNLQFDEVATLYHLLHGLCTQSELIANLLNDDLFIIMQKQLYSSKVLTKCKGVLGAVMAIKHLAGSNTTSIEAFELLKKTMNSVKSCIRSRALFFDQLSQIIASASNIDEEFLKMCTDHFEDDFVSICLEETRPEGNLVPKFGLNDPSMADSYYVNFGSGKAGAIIPVYFKLLRICNLRLSGSLESINAVLGCSVLLPEELELPDPTTADYMIHCINWFRELIGGFVTQEEPILQQQVLKRLESLMILQGDFVSMVAMCESRYQPPPCYFHQFPVPQFNRVDMKVGKKAGKKGKKKDKKEKDDSIDLTLSKSILLPEWENWEIGSELTVKNPTYFRQMDTKIINLLDTNMNIRSSQASSESVTVAQVCFIVKEILGMFGNQKSENFVRDLVNLMPKICAKLKNIVHDLRQNDSAHEREAVKLILCLLTTIFSWKEFKCARYNNLLREGLRTLASMMSESSALLRSCRDLVAEAYKYFESVSDIATQISLAVALVDVCGSLMKHSNTFTEQSKDRQAKMAYGFLCLEWDDTNGPAYRAAVKELLKVWIDNEPNPLSTVSSTLEWLPEQAILLDRPQSRLSRLPAVTKANFHLLLKQLYSGLLKGIDISLRVDHLTDPERIKIWSEVASAVDKIAGICRHNKNNAYLIIFLRYTTMLYQILLTSGMKILEANVKYQTEEVLNVIKLFQASGRFLRDIFVSARKEKNVSLLKLVPVAKSRRERFIYRVKGMLTANNSINAFWMGNLINKDLGGEEVASEDSEEMTTGADVSNENSTADEADSEIFHSDSDDDSDGE